MAGRGLRDPKNQRILHIEDNRENRMLVRAILEAEGYTIIDAEDGLSGIEGAIREQPDLILLDVNLPGVDGYEVVAVIKSFPNFATTPVIAVTAYAMEGDRQRTLVAGCDGYIQKPIDVDAFPRQVAEFLRGKREHVEEREEGIYLRELNQRLVYRLVNQVEELKRLNQHFVRRASQLAELHRAVQDITSELAITGLLERLLPQLARALGTLALTVELTDPAGVRVSVESDGKERPRSVLGGAVEPADEWVEVEWTLPLAVHGRQLGTITARHFLPPGAKADEEQLLNIVANQIAIAVENSRLYERVTQSYEATQQQLRVTETLLTVSQAVGSTLELPEVLRRTARAMTLALGADTGGAWLRTRDGRSYLPLVGYRVPKDLVPALLSMPIEVDHPLVRLVAGEDGPVYASDSQTDPRFDLPLTRLLPHRSMLIQPMRVKGEVIGGFVVVWTRERHAFVPDELRLVEAITRQAVVAIENARLLEAERQARERQRAYVEIVKEVAAEDDFERLFGIIGRRVCELSGADSAMISLVEGSDVVIRGAYRFEPVADALMRQPIAESRAGRVVRTRTAYAASDMREDPHWRDSVRARMGYRAILDVPIVLRDEVIGVLSVLSRAPRPFSDEDVSLLVELAGHVAAAIDRTNLVGELKGRLAESQTLLSVSQAVSSTLDLAEMMRRVAKATAAALGADMVGAYLADADQRFLRPIAGYHVPPSLRDVEPIPLEGHALIEAAWARHQPVASSDAADDARIDPTAFSRFPHRSLVFIPMIVKGEPIGGLFATWFEQRRVVGDDELRLVEGIARQAAVAIENSRLYEGVKRQMAELKQAQAQLIQSTKLAAIGELVANIAHEINNPLTTVLGFASFLRERLAPGAPGGDELTLIEDEAARARDIVRDLLQFSRQTDYQPAMTDLNVILEQVVGMLRRQGATDAITVNEHYASDLPPIEVDVGRIKQVFLNIVNNAIYAMPDGGTLTIRTAAAGDELHLAFQDSGSGIAPENLARVFDPFFTTKPDVSGTGLGLSVSLGIIESHGGTIAVASELGSGSTFTIKLPLGHRAPTD
ncbi:MAG: GAF domain-containing protein [Candidatus Rokubacteria bacterium]|nr:GAF domain-containing protein [Candidatus Rokubacteria bacterium]